MIAAPHHVPMVPILQPHPVTMAVGTKAVTIITPGHPVHPHHLTAPTMAHHHHHPHHPLGSLVTMPNVNPKHVWVLVVLVPHAVVGLRVGNHLGQPPIAAAHP